MKLQVGDKVKVHDGSYSYSLNPDGVIGECGLSLKGDWEVIMIGLKMPIWENLKGVKEFYKDVPDNDTMIKNDAGKIVSIQERLLTKIEPPKPAFKIGDWVKVKEDLVGGNCYGGLFFNSNMKGHLGKVGTITGCGCDGKDWRLNIDDGRWEWSSAMLEPGEAPAPKPKYSVGDKVVPVSKNAGPTSFETVKKRMEKETHKDYLIVRDVGFNVIEAGREAGGESCYWNFLESDLIPYVEPVKEEPKPEPKFK